MSRKKSLLDAFYIACCISFRNEDVSVGALLAGLDLRYVHDPRFDTEFKSRGCNNEFIITHKQSPDALQVF